MEPRKETQTDTAPRRKRKRSKSSGASTSNITSAASVDSNSEPLPIGEYEVFLSFRGPDTRNYITDILYRFLTRSKIRTFRDDDELRKGEGIWPNLVKAIGQSKISVPIFSPRYAESKWCLKELAEIVEHQKREKGHVILPIFYEVDPRDVRRQTGHFQRAFQQHKRNKFDKQTIQSWKDALKKVGTLKGWHIKAKEDAANVADDVSEVVWSHLIKNNNTLETDELVGIDDHVEQVVDMLDLGAEGVNLVGVHGMGGIGKTTLATAVYNKVSKFFDGYSFVKDIRETQKRTDGDFVLQKKLLSNILRMDSVGSEAKKIIRERVTQLKILVVLDDVDRKFNFEEVLGNFKNFAPGSRFIITTRDIKVFKKLGEGQNKLYEVQGMDPNRSLQLFCKHAFKNDSPLPDFEALSKDIVSTTGGLPLTLKVVGSFLFREEKVIWNNKLEQLRLMPDGDVMNRLKISYDDLDHEAQQIFLDIACFHIGENKEKASFIWSDCKYYPGMNINILLQRSMLKIGEDNKFRMHDQLRDMGREIVRKENIKLPEMRSRIWSEEEAHEVLVNKKGTNQVRAIRAYSAHTFGSGCFTDMTELRYFHGIKTELIGDFSHLLPNLKWMRLECRRSNSDMESTVSLNMKNMVIFDVSDCPYDYIPTKEAKKLKFLKLGDCSKMSELPEFPETLEMLHLVSFSNAEENMELRNLQNLKVLKLKSCTLGRIIGGTIGMMKGLQKLILIDIKCDYDNFKIVIADIGKLSSLESLNFASPDLKDVLEGIKLPKSLKMLTTTSNFDNFSELLDLEEVTIMSTGRTTELVISPASKLKSMELLSNSTRIIMAEGQLNTMLPSSLTSVHISDLESDRIPNLKNLSNLTELRLWNSPDLQEIQGIEGLKSLEILEMRNLEKLVHIEGLGNLMSCSNCKLSDVTIFRCPRLRAFHTFKQHDDAGTNDAVRIESLLFLEIKECPLMDCRSVPKLSQFPRLRHLSIVDIGSNINDESASQQDQLLEGLDNLVEMLVLRVRDLAKVEKLPSLSKLTKLRKLKVSGLPCVREIVGLGELNSLEMLQVADLPCFREIVGLGELKSLEELKVSGCISLERLSMEGLPKLNSIHFDLRGCTNFTDIDSDLSPLVAQGANVGGIIKWPNESDSDTGEESEEDIDIAP
ncbi:Disease resistance protein L6 [Linum grandiflorum]